MNNLIIPPATNWYEPNVVACAPDNTLIYGARNDIVVVYPAAKNSTADVKVIPRAHSQKVVSVCINKNWGAPHKYAVSVAEDKIVKLWNLETLEKKSAHDKHITHTKVVGANFGGEDRIISVSENGIIIIWNIVLNEFRKIDLLGAKDVVTCLSTCPHAGWLTAFGLKKGLVVVCDLRRDGKILYKLRGHDKSVLSLSWCPAPVNVFPQSPRNTVGVKCDEAAEETVETLSNKIDDLKIEEPSTLKEDDKINSNKENKDCEGQNTTPVDNQSTSAVDKKKNLWVNLKHADDDEVPPDFADVGRERPSAYQATNNDFLAECLKLKKQILDGTTDEDKSQEEFCTPKKSPQKQECADAGDEVQSVDQKTNNDFLAECLELRKQILDGSDAEGKEQGVEQEANNDFATECLKLKKQMLNRHTVESKSAPTTPGKSAQEQDHQEVPRLTNEDVDRTIQKEEVEQPRKEFLLASSGRESNIYIWRAGTDGRMQTFLTVPGKQHNRKTKYNNDKTWIALCWASPSCLLSSSKFGEVLQWTLPKPKDKEKQYKLVHKDHNNIVFNIACPQVLLNEYNWKSESVINVWSCGQDRLILNTSLKPERSNLACYPTFGGWIISLISSPVDANRIAIGSGEGLIKILDLSRPHTSNIYMTNFYNKIQSRVTALAWHPTKENVLAYSTLEGRVGVLDANNPSKAPTLFKQFFKNPVHELAFGPLSGDKSDFGLYAVAEGKLAIFNLKNPENEPDLLDTPENTYVYMASWKPDYSKLIVSTKSKKLLIYNTELTLESTLYLQHKFEKIIWHLDAVNDDETAYKYCNMFAGIIGNKEFAMCSIKKFEDPQQNIVNIFKGHMLDVNSLAWSPYNSKHIVSVSDDGTALVWDVETRVVISTFIHNNFEPILSVLWSPVDPDYIVIGGKDYLISIWNISQNPAKCSTDLAEQRKKILKEIQSETNDLLPKPLKDMDESIKSTNKNKKNHKNELLWNFYSPKNPETHVKDLKGLLDWKENSNGTDSDFKITKIFGSKNDMIEILNKSNVLNKQKGKYSNTNVVELIKGDIKESVESAIQEKRVTPLVLSLAPMVSTEMWQRSCDVYTEQLLEDPEADPIEIMTYLLVQHKVEQAVNVLCDFAMYKEALALAKSRFPETSSMITDVIEKWAKNSAINGNFELAAQCYIYLDQYADAATVLFRRSDVATLELASQLAEKSGNEDLYKAVLTRYNAFKSEGITTSDDQNTDCIELSTLLKEIVNNDINETDVTKISIENGVINGSTVA